MGLLRRLEKIFLWQFYNYYIDNLYDKIVCKYLFCSEHIGVEFSQILVFAAFLKPQGSTNSCSTGKPQRSHKLLPFLSLMKSIHCFLGYFKKDIISTQQLLNNC
jgi:hypothetical protein